MEWLIVYRIGDSFAAEKVNGYDIQDVLYNLPSDIDKDRIISITRTY